MTKKDYQSLIETLNSDIFCFLLIFLLENRPFGKKTLYEFMNKKLSQSPSIKSKQHYIASPSINSKFTPSLTISSSPMMQKRMTEMNTGKSNPLDRYGKASKFGTQKANPLDMYSKNTGAKVEKAAESKDSVPVKKKIMANLKDLDNIPVSSKKYENVIIEKDGTNDLNESYDEEDGIESYLYKITETKKLKKLYFKLCYKDLYCRFLIRLQRPV